MGLLDGNLDPQSMATMQLAAGLLSPGSFGQGLSKGLEGYQGTMMGAQDLQLKKQQVMAQQQAMQMQMLQMQMLKRKQDWMFGDPSTTPLAAGPATQALANGAANGSVGPTVANASAMNAQPPQQPQNAGLGRFGLPVDQERAELILNDGKDLAKMMADYHKPVSFRPGGYAMSPDGSAQQLPQVPEGFTSKRDAQGNWNISPVSGGVDAVAQASAAKAAGPAGFKTRKLLGPDNQEYEVFNKDIPGFSAGAGAPAPGNAHDYSQVSTGGSGAINPTTTTGGTSGRPQVGAKSSTASAFGSTQATDGNGGITAPVPGGPLLAQPRSMQTAILNDVQKTGAQNFTVNGAAPEAASSPVDIPGALRTGLAPGVTASANQNADNNANEVSKKWSAQLEAHQQAQTTNSYLDSIAQLSKNAKTGPFSDRIAFVNALLAPFSEQATDALSAKQLLDKYQNQITARLGSGGSATDASRAIITAAYPNSKMVPSAIMEAVDNLRGANNMTQARTKLLQPIAASRDANTNSAYDAAATNFDSNADPRLFQLKNMNPLQAQKYLSALPDNVKADLIKRAQALKSAGVL